MDFGEYQTQARNFSKFPQEYKFQYLLLGLLSEVGEVLEKMDNELFSTKTDNEIQNLFRDFVTLSNKADVIKKKIRDEGNTDYSPDNIDELFSSSRVELGKEIGDILWYKANLCDALHLSLDHVASMNLNKLNSRLSRDVISGSGDNR